MHFAQNYQKLPYYQTAPTQHHLHTTSHTPEPTLLHSQSLGIYNPTRMTQQPLNGSMQGITQQTYQPPPPQMDQDLSSGPGSAQTYTPVFMKIGTHEYYEFISYLDKNFRGHNAKSVCATCWAMCHRYQMIRHKECGHEIHTPRHCKDERSFISLCHQFKKYKNINGELHYERLNMDETVKNHPQLTSTSYSTLLNPHTAIESSTSFLHPQKAPQINNMSHYSNYQPVTPLIQPIQQPIQQPPIQQPIPVQPKESENNVFSNYFNMGSSSSAPLTPYKPPSLRTSNVIVNEINNTNTITPKLEQQFNPSGLFSAACNNSSSNNSSNNSNNASISTLESNIAVQNPQIQSAFTLPKNGIKPYIISRSERSNQESSIYEDQISDLRKELTGKYEELKSQVEQQTQVQLQIKAMINTINQTIIKLIQSRRDSEKVSLNMSEDQVSLETFDGEQNDELVVLQDGVDSKDGHQEIIIASNSPDKQNLPTSLSFYSSDDYITNLNRQSGSNDISNSQKIIERGEQ